MSTEDRIDIDIFKVVTRAVAESDNLIVMANHLSQLLVGTLGIKGCSIFILNPDSKELEPLGSFGLSMRYMAKGPLSVEVSIGGVMKREAIVISDVAESDLLQYPEDAKKEGIGAIVCIPVMLYGEPVGVMRLYHSETWDATDRDLDSLLILGEIIGLAMTYTRVLNLLQTVKGAFDDIHPIWLRSGRE